MMRIKKPRQQCVNALRASRRIGDAKAQHAPEDPNGVRIDNCVGLAEGEYTDSRCDIVTHPGERQQVVAVSWKLPATLRCHPLC